MLCIAAILLLQPAQLAPGFDMVALDVPHTLKSKALAHAKPTTVYLNKNTVVRGLHPITWTYEIKGSYGAMISTFKKEGFAVWPGGDQAYFVHKLPGMQSRLDIRAGKREAKGADYSGKSQWVTIHIMEEPTSSGPLPAWPAEAKAGPVDVPKPPGVKMLATKEPVGSRKTYAAASATSHQYTYVFSESPEKLRAKLEQELDSQWSRSANGNVFSRSTQDKWRWGLMIRKDKTNPNVTYLVVSRSMLLRDRFDKKPGK